MLEHIRRRYAARLQRLDKPHRLVGRFEALPHVVRDLQRFRRPTRLRRAWGVLPTGERPELRVKGEPPFRPGRLGRKKVEALRFYNWLKGRTEDWLAMYTDGSLLETGAAGWGYVVMEYEVDPFDGGSAPPHRVVATGYGRLDRVDVFDAEAVAALRGLETCLRPRTDPAVPVVVMLDNSPVVNCLKGRPPESSRKVFVAFQEIAEHEDVSV
jgi:ribonuclease HI